MANKSPFYDKKMLYKVIFIQFKDEFLVLLKFSFIKIFYINEFYDIEIQLLILHLLETKFLFMYKFGDLYVLSIAKYDNSKTTSLKKV